jgi:hypothetical protein
MSTAVWEYRELAFPQHVPRELAREVLTASAETQRWELDRTRIFRDGRRVVRLRRRVYRFSTS